MGKRYYPDSENYPEVLKAIDLAIRTHICTVLYTEDDLADAMGLNDTEDETFGRIVLADIGGGGNDAGLDSMVDYGMATNQRFPFTAYNINLPEPLDNGKNHTALSGAFYSSAINSMAKRKPMQVEFQMITFFNRWQDLIRGHDILTGLAASLSRLYVPLIVNDTQISFAVDIDYEITQGEYHGSFQTWLQKGKINDLVHNITVKYFDFTIDNENVHAIEDIEVYANALNDPDNISNEVNTNIPGTITLPDIPKILSTTPTNEETGVDPDNILTSIIINFNQAMNEETVEDNFRIVPHVDGKFIWNDESTQMIYDITENLQSGITYYLYVYRNLNGAIAQSIWTHPLEEDYEFSFTTQ